MVRSALIAVLFATITTAVKLNGLEQGRDKPTLSYDKIVPGAFIIEFEGGQDVKVLRRQAEPEFTTRLDLNFKLFNGVSIQLKDAKNAEEQASKLGSLPAVKNIWPVRVYDRPQTENHWVRKSGGGLKTGGILKRQGNGTTQAYSPHVMTQVDKVHAMGFTGKGIKVAVIDGGIDYTHPALGGCFGQGCKVSFGYDFVGDDYEENEIPVPDDDPMDCDGHGTHVAGILAAAKGDMGMIGAAPGVTLGAYRVFGCKGGVGDDILIAAFNKAYEDGADIITASIGGANGWPHGPWIDTVSRIVEKGIPCTLSAGNDGMRGLFLTGGAAAGYGATSVTSFDNVIQGTEYDEAYYQLNGGSRVGIPFRFYEDGRYKPDFDGVSRPVYVPESDACQELPKDSPDLSNYNVLLAFADCGAEIQAENIFAKGGRTISFYYDGEGLDPRGIGYWTFASPKAFKFITFLQFEAAKTFQRALNSGYNVSIEFPHPDNGNRNMVFLPNTQTPGAVSEASSWGPTYEVSIKPQFGAPGGYILSTFLNESYALKSGTSMATPLVAGAYALIAEARATLDPAIIQSLLSATSKQQSFLDPYEGGYQDYLAPPMQQGNGIIQVYDALQLTSSLKPTSLSFNDTAHFTQTVNFTISNEGRKDITYEISHVPVTHSFNTLQENSVAHEFAPYSPAKGHAEIEFSSSKVTLSPGGSATISVTATPPKGLDIIRYPIWSGYITLNGSDATSLSLPYLGVEGSLYSATYFDEEGVKMYSTDSLDDNPLYNHTFTVPAPGKPIPEDIQSAKLPLFWARNLWGVPLVYADLVPVASCSNLTRAATGSRPIGQIMGFPKRWVPEKSMDEIFVGQLGNGDYAPPGRYKVVMRALRIFGDEKNDNDWIVKETQSFGIRYGS